MATESKHEYEERFKAHTLSVKDLPWSHRGPSNDSWNLWEKYDHPHSWTLPRPFRGNAAIPHNETKEQVGEEYFGPHPMESRLAAACGFGGSSISHPSESYIVVNVTKPTLMPFIVPMNQSNRIDAAVIVVPGGGGIQLSWESEGMDVASWLNSIGISAFVLKYRVPEELHGSAAGVADLQRALTLVRFAAPALGVSASRVGALAFSYGAGLGVLAAGSAARRYAAGDEADASADFRPDFLVMLYPAMPMEVVRPTEEQRRAYQRKLLPQMFVAGVEDDTCVQYGHLLVGYASLPREKVELHLYPRGLHGFGTCVRKGPEFMQRAEACRWLDRARRFLLRHVSGSAGSEALSAYEARRAEAQKRPGEA